MRIVPVTLIAITVALLPARSLLAQDSTRRTLAIPHVLEAVDKAIQEPMPAGLNPADQQQYTAETEWLKAARTRIESLGVKLGVITAPEPSSGMATGRRQYRPDEITMQVDALKQALIAESRKFNTMSNASKVRHDIAMNAIRNMKA